MACPPAIHIPGSIRPLARSEQSTAAIDQIPHLEDLSTMARGTSVALVGGFLGSVLGWVSQLLLARLLGPEGFGWPLLNERLWSPVD